MRKIKNTECIGTMIGNGKNAEILSHCVNVLLLSSILNIIPWHGRTDD